MTTDEDKCHICSNTRAWHEENQPHHSFVLIGQSEGGTAQLSPKKTKEKASKQTRVEVRQWPHDPILRIALVNKGILTMADIETAEQQLREAAKHGQTVVLSGPEQRSDIGTDVQLGSGDSSG